MIFITAKWAIKPEHADDWPQIARDFTEGARSEAGCLWFDWSRSIDDPHEYVLVEAFRDDDAGAAHMQSAHTQRALAELPAYLSATPKIVNARVDGDAWSDLGEMAVQ